MKKYILSLLLSISLCLSTFCQSVIVLKDNASIRKENETGGLIYAMEVLPGIKMELLSAEPVLKDLVTSKQITEDISFYHVNYQGKEYYIRENEAAIGSSVAVITNEAVLFTNPKLNEFRNAYLEPGTIVSFTDSVMRNGINFVEIEFYDTNAWTKRTRYVLESDITSNSNDIEAMQLIKKVSTLKDKNLQKELLNTASSLDISTSITEILTNVEESIFGVEYSEDDFEPYQAELVTYTEDGSLLNVRDFPLNGNVLFQVESGVKIKTSVKSCEEENIDGAKGYWYKVTFPDFPDLAEGWLFGAYTQPLQ